jgi:hypothetical protein
LFFFKWTSAQHLLALHTFNLSKPSMFALLIKCKRNTLKHSRTILL